MGRGLTELRRLGLALVFSAIVTAPVYAKQDNVQESGTWQEIKPDLFDTAEIADGSHLMTFTTPYRAHDAALVPFSFAAKPGVVLKNVAIVIDENPAPLAATITFGPAAGKYAFTSRFRVNAYSYVRAVAQTSDGHYYMVKNYIKASGGCSAPAGKDMDQALAQLGRMKFVRPADGQEGEAQIMIRHPNFSGLQMDQLTHLYIPAHFMDSIEIRQGQDMLLHIEGGISLSEDPNIRFYYQPGGAKEISVRASDTEQNLFLKNWTLDAGT